jgi:hypothetical protein
MWRKNTVSKKFMKTGLVILGILAVWTALTLWAEYSGKENTYFEGSDTAARKALIVYNPDPIYNLDEQISKSFAKGLSQYDLRVKITTVNEAKKDNYDYDIYVFCANTYNWAPDWQVKGYIRDHPRLQKQNVVAITLGSGSTSRSKRILEETIRSKQANLLASRTYWLLRPNDEDRMDESNIAVANDMARALGEEVGKYLPKNVP